MYMELFDAAESICNGIKKALQEKTGYLVGRNGTIEMETLLTHTYKKINPEQLHILERNAGVFPKANVAEWVKQTEEAIKNTDLLVAAWYEPYKQAELAYLTNLFSSDKSPFLPLRALEPYYVPEHIQWTQYLHKKNVAVITSFAETAKAQLEKREAIWGDRCETLLPDANYIFIQTGYSPSLAKGKGEWPSGIHSWQDAVDHMVQKVVEADSDIVLIGCGGLSMIIGSRLKALGKICIVMGGAIQVLFGIKGNRWESHPVIGRFWNSAWVYPTKDETPGGAMGVERSCYWH